MNADSTERRHLGGGFRRSPAGCRRSRVPQLRRSGRFLAQGVSPGSRRRWRESPNGAEESSWSCSSLSPFQGWPAWAVQSQGSRPGLLFFRAFGALSFIAKRGISVADYSGPFLAWARWRWSFVAMVRSVSGTFLFMVRNFRSLGFNRGSRCRETSIGVFGLFSRFFVMM